MSLEAGLPPSVPRADLAMDAAIAVIHNTDNVGASVRLALGGGRGEHHSNLQSVIP